MTACLYLAINRLVLPSFKQTLTQPLEFLVETLDSAPYSWTKRPQTESPYGTNLVGYYLFHIPKSDLASALQPHFAVIDMEVTLFPHRIARLREVHSETLAKPIVPEFSCVEVNFAPTEEQLWAISRKNLAGYSLTLDNQYDIMHLSKHPLRVLATVIDITKTFVQQQPVIGRSLMFSAAEENRQRVYRAALRRLLPTLPPDGRWCYGEFRHIYGGALVFVLMHESKWKENFGDRPPTWKSYAA